MPRSASGTARGTRRRFRSRPSSREAPHPATATSGLHQSGMSYSYQDPKFEPFRPLDYSREELPALFEPDLDENAGIGAGSGRVGYGLNRAGQVVDAGGPVDWNGDGPFGPFDSSVSADVNYLLKSDGTVLGDCGPSAGQT